MTARARRRERRPTLLADDVPAVAGFARAYLHQDVLAEHGGAAEAVRAFCRDASADEQTALATDFARLIIEAAHWPEAALARWFQNDLGAAWAPDSFEDLVELGAAAARAPRRTP